MKKIVDYLGIYLVFVAKNGFRSLFFEALFVFALAWAASLFGDIIPFKWALVILAVLTIILLIGYGLAKLFVPTAKNSKEIVVQHLMGEFVDSGTAFFNLPPHGHIIFTGLAGEIDNIETIEIQISADSHSKDVEDEKSEEIFAVDLTFKLIIPAGLISAKNIKNVFEFFKKESHNLADLMDSDFQISVADCLKQLVLKRIDARCSLNQLAITMASGEVSYIKARKAMIPISADIADYLKGLSPDDQSVLGSGLVLESALIYSTN